MQSTGTNFTNKSFAPGRPDQKHRTRVHGSYRGGSDPAPIGSNLRRPCFGPMNNRARLEPPPEAPLFSLLSKLSMNSRCFQQGLTNVAVISITIFKIEPSPIRISISFGRRPIR